LIGSFTFVLHSHLPYARQAGRWPHGEEWVHEALTETYIPLLDGLNELRDEGVAFKLTVGLTPVLLEQLADDLIKENFEHFIGEKVERAEADCHRFTAANDSRLSIARFWHEFYARVRESFANRYKRDVVGAFADLARTGHLDILTSAATHGYLPLLSRDSSIRGQLRTGTRSSLRQLGFQPGSIWLPECAYRPASSGADGVSRPPIETFLSEVDIRCFFVESQLIEGGKPIGKTAGDAVGPYGEIRQRYAVPAVGSREPSGTTFQPYLVGESNVAVLARNSRIGLQVWSGDHGYPGDYWYREFHKKDGVSGLNYWRISGATVDLADKEEYDPARAFARTEDHAQHFADLVRELLSEYQQASGIPGIVVATYDTELFGHWWFEGVSWLTKVLRKLSTDSDIELTSASQYIAESPPREAIDLPEGSWGQGGNHFTWYNADTQWMWPIIYEAESTMEELSRASSPGQVETLNQAARELLLLQASDWPFLVTTGQAHDYAVQRFLLHVERFRELAGLLRSGLGSRDRAAELFELDKVFPDIDYRDFAPSSAP
jgi:1,4-alpha-glucan branching enzyme